jgi:hypothetical protein
MARCIPALVCLCLSGLGRADEKYEPAVDAERKKAIVAALAKKRTAEIRRIETMMNYPVKPFMVPTGRIYGEPVAKQIAAAKQELEAYKKDLFHGAPELGRRDADGRPHQWGKLVDVVVLHVFDSKTHVVRQNKPANPIDFEILGPPEKDWARDARPKLSGLYAIVAVHKIDGGEISAVRRVDVTFGDVADEVLANAKAEPPAPPAQPSRGATVVPNRWQHIIAYYPKTAAAGEAQKKLDADALALLEQARDQLAAKEKAGGRALLHQIVTDYDSTPAAAEARKLLKSMTK